MEPSMIPHIAKDCFDFKNGLDKHCPNGTTLVTRDIGTRDIKSLYTTIRLDLFYKKVEYWMNSIILT